MNGELLQIRQRTKAGSKIIQADAESKIHQLGKHAPRAVHIHQHAFGNFNVQTFRVNPALADDADDVADHVRLQKMPRRNIDADANRRQTRLVPDCDLPASLCQHPLINRHNQVTFFSNRNKYRRRHDRAAIAPAHQSLYPHNGIVGKVDLWLVFQH